MEHVPLRHYNNYSCLLKLSPTMNIAPRSRESFPRVLPTTSEFLESAPIGGQKYSVPGDPQKLTPQGKYILSSRAKLLNKIGNDKRNNSSNPATFGLREIPRRVGPSAKHVMGGRAKRAADARREAPLRAKRK